jgi:hypothetical protein
LSVDLVSCFAIGYLRAPNPSDEAIPMGRFDSRNSTKMRQRRAQAKKKARERAAREQGQKKK